MRFKNAVRKVSSRLLKKGIGFAEVSGNNIVLHEAADTASDLSGAAKLGKSLAKGTVILGIMLTVSMSAERAYAATVEDLHYQEVMRELGVQDPPFANASLKREMALIGGEETGSWGLGAVSGAVGTFFGAGPWGTAAGVAGGSIVGDYAGGGLAGWIYDISNKLSDSELQSILSAEPE